MFKQILEIVEIVIAVLIIVLIILQSKGTGIGSTFGGDMGFYATKRGAEKMMFIITIILSFFFLVIPIIEVVL